MQQEFWERLQDAKKIIVFGAGRIGSALYRECKTRYKDKLVVICDNYRGRGESIDDVYKPMDVLDDIDATVLISGVRKETIKEIKGTLNQNKIEPFAGVIMKKLLQIRAEKSYRLMRERLKNKNISIISSNCTDGIIYHNLKERFLSPTINLFFDPDDFVRFAEDIKYYIGKNLVEGPVKEIEIHGRTRKYPTGYVGDVEINFLHYKTFHEAEEMWNRRKKRINYDNLFFILTKCTLDTARKFDMIEQKNKAYLTYKDEPGISCKFVVPSLKEDKEDFMRGIFDLKPDNSGLRWIDDWDYVSFLNGKVVE